MIDRTTLWPEYCLLADTSARSCALGFVSTWVARFGSQALLTSVRGNQFTSEVTIFSEFTKVELHLITPESNGLVECFH